MRKDEFYSGVIAGFPATSMPPVRAASVDGPNAGMRHEAGPRQQYREAIEEHRRAAEQGNRAAQEILGLMCLCGPQIYGDAVERDLGEAHRWLWLAAAQGSLVARHLLRRIDPKPAIGAGEPALN
jgi:TPR repeat protein